MNAFLDALEARGELPAACATIAFWRDLCAGIVEKSRAHEDEERQARGGRDSSPGLPGPGFLSRSPRRQSSAAAAAFFSSRNAAREAS